jgi:hypothetical protein
MADYNVTSNSAYMHVVEAFIDGKKGATVSNIFIDFDLAVQVI